MSGKCTKALRRQLAAAGIEVDANGWRRVKRAWGELSREEQATVTAPMLVEGLRAQMARRNQRRRELTEKRLRALPRKTLEKPYRQTTGRP